MNILIFFILTLYQQYVYIITNFANMIFSTSSKFFFIFIIFSLFFISNDIFAQENLVKEFKTLDSLGQIFWKKSSYNRALIHYEKALAIAKQLKDTKKETRVYNYLGVICENQGNFASSFDYHFQAIRIREREKDILLAQSYVNLGITYSTSGQMNKGIEYYLKCIEINKKNNNKKLDAHAYYHLSTSFRINKEYEKANEYAQKALKMAILIKEKVIEIDAQNGLGLIATEQKQYEKAREYYKKVYDLAIKEKDWLILTNNLQHFAENYQQNKEYAKAVEYAEKSLELAKKYELKNEEKNAYKILADLYDSQFQYQKAYEYHTKFEALKDTLFNLEKNKQILELTFRYETEKKEQKIEILEKNKKINQNTIFVLFLGIFLLAFILVGLFYRYKTIQIFRKQEEQIAKEKNKSLESELLLKETKIKIENDRFEEEMAYKERELASTALHIFQKNEILNILQEKLMNLDLTSGAEVKSIFSEIRNNINLDKGWEIFEMHFIKVHPDFFEKLQKNYPTLTTHELKLLSYIRLKLSNKEIASMLNILPKSVEMSRYRIKKKFNLLTDDNLDKWLLENY
ncbi:MAG: hypothetical protein EAZ85_09465 [Bacteroidetes bacterium]|nr:MAG: hypothetical protein EAZ85_09465 [Bacteroidota bacterium]TAG88638.1 MAG: hypothetical protein EAZ20_08120 [Bacteroidota bacterium]